MRFMPLRFAPPQGPPLRESLREFEQNYFTTSNSQRPRCDPPAEFCNPWWTEQPSFLWMGNQEPFEQPSVPQRSLDDTLAELAECVKQFVDSMPNTKPSAKIIKEQDGQLEYQFTEHGNESYSNFYNQWTEHPTSMWVSNQQAFQQPCVPQKLSLEDQIAKLEESTRLFMGSTPKWQSKNSIDNLAHQIGHLTYQLAEQANDSNSNFPNQPIANLQGSKECTADQTLEESEIEEPPTSYTCPTEEITLVDPKPMATQVYVRPEAFPKGLHKSTRIDMLEAVHTKAVYETSHDQLLNTLTILDPQPTDQKILAAELDMPTSQFIKFKEN